jgi:predicted O-linked N-acetylglucosamine transferase (SPINDLY family)
MAKNGFRPPHRPAQQNPAVTALLDQAGRLLGAGKGAEAVPMLTKVVAMAPANPQAAHMLGVAYLQTGRLADGIESLKKAVMLAPRAAPVLNHLGVALCQAGRSDEGIVYLRKAVDLAPALADARNNLAHALSERGDYAAAADAYRTLLAASPDMLPAWHGLLSALHRSGDLAGALELAQTAVGRFPTNSVLHASLGRILVDLRRQADAEAALRQALALDDGNGEAANNLGTLLEDLGRGQEASAFYLHATRVRPDLADGWFNLGSSREKTGDLDGARAALASALALRPDDSRTLASLIGVRRKLCDWPGLDAEVARLVELIGRPDFALDAKDSPQPFSMLSLMVEAPVQRRVAEAHSRFVADRAEAFRPQVAAFTAPARPAGVFARPAGVEKLRIGYLSPDFREHPIGHLMAGVIEAHDRDRFEVSAWSLGPDDKSAFRARIAAGADRFEDIRSLDISAATQRMRDAELDVVIDLAGYTAHARPEILALRVAPVQVNYLGFPGTMGAPFMDAVIVDSVIADAEDQSHYSERVYRLPDCYQANDDRMEIAADPVTRGENGLPDQAFVFCCFSMNYKIDAAVMDAWAAVLAGVDNAVLWLFRTDAAAADNLAREAAARGIDPARIIFADRLPKARHLARHRLADLFLDTFAYGAHTTASDALWAGLPVLTLKGDTFARRVGASIVTAAGMPDLVTTTVDAYVARAIEIATTPDAAAALKAQLAANLPHSPLFSTATIARNLEAAYLDMVAAAVHG